MYACSTLYRTCTAVPDSPKLLAMPVTEFYCSRYVFVSVYRGNLFFLGIVENEVWSYLHQEGNILFAFETRNCDMQVPPIGVIELLLRIVTVLSKYLNNKMDEVIKLD